MKIGIGIPTFNRLEALKAMVESLKRTVTEPHDLFISDDGSTDGVTIPWLKQSGIEFVTDTNTGVVYSKNRIINRFKDYDFVFIIEDDVLLLNPGWDTLYIKALTESKTHHLNFIPYQDKLPSGPMKEGIKVVDELVLPSATIYSCNMLSGTFMVMTKKAIEVCGGMDFRFQGYGLGHCEYTERIHRAGLTKFKLATVKSSKDYIKFQSVRSTCTRDEKKVSVDKNREVLKVASVDPSVWREFDIEKYRNSKDKAV